MRGAQGPGRPGRTMSEPTRAPRSVGTSWLPTCLAKPASTSHALTSGRPGSAGSIATGTVGSGSALTRRRSRSRASRRRHSRQRRRYFSNAAAGFAWAQPSHTFAAGSEQLDETPAADRAELRRRLGARPGGLCGLVGGAVAGREPLLDELGELGAVLADELGDPSLELDSDLLGHRGGSTTPATGPTGRERCPSPRSRCH